MQSEMGRVPMTSSNEGVVIDNAVVSQEWRVDFAQIYAAFESCTSVQGGRVASILCEALGLLTPLTAVGVVLADHDLLAALRVLTREVRDDSQSAYPDLTPFGALVHRA
jgi:hypothetical protein